MADDLRLINGSGSKLSWLRKIHLAPGHHTVRWANRPDKNWCFTRQTVYSHAMLRKIKLIFVIPKIQYTTTTHNLSLMLPISIWQVFYCCEFRSSPEPLSVNVFSHSQLTQVVLETSFTNIYFLLVRTHHAKNNYQHRYCFTVKWSTL